MGNSKFLLCRIPKDLAHQFCLPLTSEHGRKGLLAMKKTTNHTIFPFIAHCAMAVFDSHKKETEIIFFQNNFSICISFFFQKWGSGWNWRCGIRRWYCTYNKREREKNNLKNDYWLIGHDKWIRTLSNSKMIQHFRDQ